MTDEENTGCSIAEAKELILMLIESRPGIRPSSIETALVRKGGQSNRGMSRAMLYRALDSLKEEGLVETEKADGKRAVAYYPKGRRPNVVRTDLPSRFDEFVVGECERVLREMVDAQVLYSSPTGNNRRNEGDRSPDIDSRLISTYHLVATWEDMRGQSVRRPWGKDVHEFAIGLNLVQLKSMKYTMSIKTKTPSMIEWFNFYTNAIDQISRSYIRKLGRR